MTRLDPDPLQVNADPPVPHRPHVGCWPLVALGIALTLAWLIATPSSALAPSAPSLTGAPLGTSRTNPKSLNALEASQLGAGDEVRVPASGAPTRSGIWSFANPSHGSRYLATPEPRGTRIRVCGPFGCRTLITNDVGPVLSLQRAGRIGDLSAVTFVAICGDLRAGLCVGSYVVLPALPPLPATDEEAK